MNTSQSHIDDKYKDGYRDNDPDRLEQEVNEARARIGERLETLSHRLSPGELLDQVLGMAREHGGEFTRNLGSQIKNNPVPLIITGIGMSWLMMASNSPGYQRSRYGYDRTGNAQYNRYTDGVTEYPYTESTYDQNSYYAGRDNEADPDIADKARSAMETVGEEAEHLKDSAKEKLHRASDTLHRGVHSAQERVHSAQQRMRSVRDHMPSVQGTVRSTQECVTDFLYEQPVLAASLGVALGAAIGALLPATEVEDRVLGSVSEQAAAKAEEVATEQYGKVKEKAREVAQNVKQQMQGDADSQPASGTQPESTNSDYSAPGNQAS